MIKNKYNLSKGLWDQMKSNLSRRVFNSVMNQALHNQSLTIHPKAIKVTPAQWTTTCINMALYAAWAIDKSPLQKGDKVEMVNPNSGKVISTTKVK